MTNCRLRFFCCGILALMLTGVAKTQCTLDVNADIEDITTLNLQISVDNLVNDDLSGTQAICAVELHFRHYYLGDLTIDLISPGGQIVQLVGGVTDQINPTNLTTWDVQFLQCGFPASPDPGFTAQWNNNQAWQVFTTYSGSYYPAVGCLEDFNVGSANGLWRLRITDHDAPQAGVLLGVTLIFCDNSGLECIVCGADAGMFSQPMASICEGTEFTIEPVYSDTIPDPLLYGYTFLLTEDHVNIIYAGEVLTSALSPGTYTICGMSYHYQDSSDLFAQLDTLTFNEIQTAFANDELSTCADLTEGCLTLEINPFIDTTFLNQQICDGTSVAIGGQIFSSPGIYDVVIDVAGVCDSIVVLELDIVMVEARVLQQDTISCTASMTTLDGSISIAGPGASYTWTTTNGTILGPADQAVITIDGSGTYALSVTYQGCTDEIFYDVIGDSSIPFLFVSGGTLDCDNPNFIFNPVTFPLVVEYLWSGPAGFSSTESNPIVSMPGTYTLMITVPQGCAVSTTAEILVDTTLIPSIDLVSVECALQRATLSAQQGLSGYTFLWTLPGGNTSTDQEIYAMTSGQYCVEVTGANGCFAITCMDFVVDFNYPDVSIMATDDSLHCNQPVTLTASSVTPGATFQWNGPGGGLPAGAIQEASSPGQYIIDVTGTNQCVGTDTIDIYAGTDLLDFGTFTDTLNCSRDTVLIGMLIFDPGISYTWDGPGLVDTDLTVVRVVSPGMYEVRIEDLSGCIQYASIAVEGDYQTVDFAISPDTITCNGPVASLSFTALHPYEVIDWIAPDGSHSNQPVLNTNDAGSYTLTLTGENGCPQTHEIEILTDTLGPVLFLDSELLGCIDSVQIQTISIDSILSYQWSGPGGFVSNLASPQVNISGEYLLIVNGINGCEAHYTHVVESDLDFPLLMLTAEELDCIDSTAVLMMMSPDTALVFAWYSDGLQIADTSVVTVTTPGQYIGSVTASNGCIVVDSIEVLPPLIPTVQMQTDTITCVSEATVTATSDLPDAVFFWSDAAGISGMGPQFTTAETGTLMLRVVGTNGCSTDTTLIIESDTLAPVAIALSNEMILCNVQTISLDASGSVGQISIYQWNTPDGVIESGANTPFPLITGEGVYVVMVTDGSNGCVDADTIDIEEAQSTLGEIYYTAISECEGNGNGSIAIDSVSGGNTSISYTINGEVGGPLFERLTNGEYHIGIVDSFGCRTDTIINIANTSSTYTISFGEDKSILIGDSILLEALVDLDSSEIQSVRWGQPVNCDTCLINMVSPIQTTAFEIYLTDVFGCTARDEVIVFVDERPKFFIPNIFSPNGDNTNDYLTVSTHPGIERVLNFSIYDRWGNVVFQETDFQGSDPSVSWDGTFGGKELNPAVFVYILEVVLLTGRVETNHGTVTLVK